MSWKKITHTKTSEQLDLFSQEEPQDEEVKPKKPAMRRSEYFFLKPYEASGSANCDTHPSECHQSGRVERGDKMIIAIPMKGVRGRNYYFHDGPCSQTGIKRIDEEADRAIRNR